MEVCCSLAMFYAQLLTTLPWAKLRGSVEFRSLAIYVLITSKKVAVWCWFGSINFEKNVPRNFSGTVWSCRLQNDADQHSNYNLAWQVCCRFSPNLLARFKFVKKVFSWSITIYTTIIIDVFAVTCCNFDLNIECSVGNLKIKRKTCKHFEISFFCQ